MASTLQSAFRILCHNRIAFKGGLRCFSAASQMATQSPLANKDQRIITNNNNRQNVTEYGQKHSLQFKSIAQMSYDNTNKIHNKINDLITKGGKRVFVFMKGVPKAPACGYSNAVVQILEAYGVEFDSFDVLEDDEVRQEIKTYSEWPTIPQVYVDGNFVGGCDILLQMHQSGELVQLFEEKKGKGTEG